MQCAVGEPWSRTGKFGVIFPECQEDAATKTKPGWKPLPQSTEIKAAIKKTECYKEKKGNADNRSARKCEM